MLLASLAVFNVANHPTEGFLQGPAGLGALCGSLGQGICWPAAVRGHAAPQCFMRERQSSAVAAPSGQPNEQIGRWRTRTSFPAVPKQEVQHVLASYTAAPQRADSAVGVRPAAASVAIAERAPELLGHIGRGNGCRLAIYREKRFNARFDEYLLTKRSPDKRFTQEHRTWMHYQRQRHAVGGLSKQRVARFEEEDLDLSLDEVPLLATTNAFMSDPQSLHHPPCCNVSLRRVQTRLPHPPSLLRGARQLHCKHIQMSEMPFALHPPACHRHNNLLRNTEV